MGKNSAGNSEIRFAPYLESAHYKMINKGGSDLLTYSVFGCINTAFDNSPYSEYTDVAAEDGFLGVGYQVGQFPSLFDMYGKFMASLDVESLWSETYASTVTGPEVGAAVEAHSDILQDEIETKILPDLLLGYRSLNAVNSSAFALSIGQVYGAKVKSISQFASQLQLHMIDLVQSRWAGHLDWNKSVITVYSDMLKLFYSAKFDADARNMEFAVKDKLWNLSLFDYARAIVGTLNGSASTKTTPEPSQTMKSISAAMAGAGAGATIGQQIAPQGSGAAWGAGVGGVLGLAASFAM